MIDWLYRGAAGLLLALGLAAVPGNAEAQSASSEPIAVGQTVEKVFCENTAAYRPCGDLRVVCFKLLAGASPAGETALARVTIRTTLRKDGKLQDPVHTVYPAVSDDKRNCYVVKYASHADILAAMYEGKAWQLADVTMFVSSLNAAGTVFFDTQRMKKPKTWPDTVSP